MAETKEELAERLAGEEFRVAELEARVRDLQQQAQTLAERNRGLAEYAGKIETKLAAVSSALSGLATVIEK